MTEREDYQELADDLDHEADRLQHEGDRLGEHIADTKQDWEQKRADDGVPGANAPEPGEASGSESAEKSDGADDSETGAG